MMEQTLIDPSLTGEERERRARRRFWKILGGIAVVGAPFGAVVGFLMGRDGFSLGDTAARLPGWFFVFAAAIYALSVVVGTALFVRAVDEVELADNLWGSAAGFYAYGIGFPCWWALWKAGLVTQPDPWLIFVGVFLAGFGVYAARKVRAAR